MAELPQPFPHTTEAVYAALAKEASGGDSAGIAVSDAKRPADGDRTEYFRAWRAANRERIRLKSAAYYKAHPRDPEKKKSYDAEYRKRAAQRIKETCNAYKAQNADVILEKARKRAAEYRLKFPERIKQSKLAYGKTHSDEQRKYWREWRAENRGRLKALAKIWKAKNPGKLKEFCHNRRARKLSADGTHTAADVERIFTAQSGKCAGPSCRCSLKGGYHIDHIQPLARGGSNWPRNLQLLCPSCNMRKYSKDPIDWARQHGRLI